MHSNSNQFGQYSSQVNHTQQAPNNPQFQGSQNPQSHHMNPLSPHRAQNSKQKGNTCSDFFFSEDHILGLKCCGRKRRVREFLEGSDHDPNYQQRLSKGGQSNGSSQMTFGKTRNLQGVEKRNSFDAPSPVGEKSKIGAGNSSRLNPEVNGYQSEQQSLGPQKRQRLDTEVQNLNLIIQRQHKQIQSLLHREKEVSSRYVRGQPSPFQTYRNQVAQNQAQKDTRPKTFREMSNRLQNRMKYYEGSPKFLPPPQQDFSQASNHSKKPSDSANNTSAHNLILNSIEENSRIENFHKKQGEQSASIQENKMQKLNGFMQSHSSSKNESPNIGFKSGKQYSPIEPTPLNGPTPSSQKPSPFRFENTPIKGAPQKDSKLVKIQEQIKSQNLLLIRHQQQLQSLQRQKTSDHIMMTDIASVKKKNQNYTRVPANSQDGDQDMENFQEQEKNFQDFDDNEPEEFARPSRDSEVGRNMPRLNRDVVNRKRGERAKMTQIHQCQESVVNKIAHRVRCKIQYIFGHKIRVFSFEELKSKSNFEFFKQMEQRHLKDVEGYLILNTMKNDMGTNIGVEITLVDKFKIHKSRLSFDGSRQSLLPQSPECVKQRAEVKELVQNVFQMLQGSGSPSKQVVPQISAEVIITGTNPIFALVCILYQYLLATKSNDNFKLVFQGLSNAKGFDEVMRLFKDQKLTEYWTYTTLNLLVD